MCSRQFNVFTDGGRAAVFVWRNSRPAVLCVRRSWSIRPLPSVDTCSADSALGYTGTSLLHQDPRPAPSVGKNPEQELDRLQPIRPTVLQVRLNISNQSFLLSLLNQVHVFSWDWDILFLKDSWDKLCQLVYVFPANVTGMSVFNPATYYVWFNPAPLLLLQEEGRNV